MPGIAWSFYAQLDLADAVIENGHKVPAVNLWVKGKHEARVDFTDVGDGSTPYPFLHIFPQDEHEKLLIRRLEEMGVAVERQTELTGFTDQDGTDHARPEDQKRPNGAETVTLPLSLPML